MLNKSLIILLLVVSCSTFGQTKESIYNQDKKRAIEYLRSETIGGKLDFELKMKEDKVPFYLFEKVAYNRKDFGILLWAQAVKITGQFSRKEAEQLWEKIKKRTLTKPEKKAFKTGFKIELKQ